MIDEDWSMLANIGPDKSDAVNEQDSTIYVNLETFYEWFLCFLT